MSKGMSMCSRHIIILGMFEGWVQSPVSCEYFFLFVHNDTIS